MKFSKKLLTFARILDYKITGKRYPLIVNISVTNKCNFRCSYCNVYSKKVPEMSLEKIKSIIDKLERHCIFINLHGGEPLLRKDIGEIIDYIQSKDGIYCSLYTNGWLITNKLDSLTKLDCIAISLDGPEQIHDALRKKGSYSKIIKGIRILKEKNIRIVFNFTLTNKNAHVVSDFLKISNDLSVIPFVTVVYKYAYSSKLASNLAPSKNQIISTLKILKEYYTKNKLFFEYPKAFVNFPIPYLNSNNCPSGKLFLHIEPNGDILACPYQVPFQDKYNVFKDDVMEIINNLRFSCNGCWCPPTIDISLSMNNLFKSLIRWFFSRDERLL